MKALKRDFKIARLTKEDARFSTDHLKIFKELIMGNEIMYPNIDKWYKNKVVRGLKSSQRVGFVGYVNENPIVSAIVKLGKNSKFCHLRISQDFQDENLGEVFFALMALEVRKNADEIHFTLPEGLWENKKAFFQSFGFKEAILAGTQYRLFEKELRCSAPFSEVWAVVLKKLPKIADIFSVGGYSMDNRLLLSIQPKNAERILDRKKKVEIRKRFARKWKGHKVSLYSSRPIRSLVGEALIEEVVSGAPNDIWERFNVCIGCNKNEYDEYTNSAKEVYAIVLEDIKPYQIPIPISQVSHILNKDLKPPQSYYTLKKNEPWADAISIAALLYGSFKNTEAKSRLLGVR